MDKQRESDSKSIQENEITEDTPIEDLINDIENSTTKKKKKRRRNKNKNK